MMIYDATPRRRISTRCSYGLSFCRSFNTASSRESLSQRNWTHRYLSSRKQEAIETTNKLVAVKSSLLFSSPQIFSHDKVKSSINRGDEKTTTVRNNYNLIQYCRSWAWQNWLLHQRLQLRKQGQSASQQEQNNNHDQDVILLLEHDHVYTLGRGADENYLTFLQQQQPQDKTTNPEQDQQRHRLSRSNRGPGSARLSVDSTTLQRIHTRSLNYNGNTSDQQTWTPDDNDSTHLWVNDLAEWAITSFDPVLAPNGVPIYRVERGGEVTYHGPGQLVVYPLLDLKQGEPLQANLHWFLRAVEEVIIETLFELGIPNACRDEINTGVWVDGAKVAAIGVAASRWITTHGFALNVDPDLNYFDTSVILPCGIEGRSVTSIGQLLRKQHGPHVRVPTIPQVAMVVLQKFKQVLNIQLEHPTGIQ